MDALRPHLRIVRDPEQLGSYIRPLARDYQYLAGMIATGVSVCDGVVLDARSPVRSRDLRQIAVEEDLDLILDPQSVELATPGGWSRTGVPDLPWAGPVMDEPTYFDRKRRAEFTESIAQTVIDVGASSVLAPAHYHDGFPSAWLEVDHQLTAGLRRALNRKPGGADVRIYFPLITKLAALRSESVRTRVIDGLRDLANRETIDALWLRIHSFGTTNSGPLNLKRYLQVCRDLHRLNVPVVGERTGTIGLAVMAFGAVSGIESGITHGDRYDVNSLRKVPRGDGRGFTIPPRVYLPQIGALLHREAAAEFLNRRGIKSWFGCQLPCCRRGIMDTLSHPRRHFLVTREEEVRRLERAPQEARVEEYASWLRLASDRAVRAARVLPELESHRKRLDQWRATLSEIRDRDARCRPSIAVSIQRLRDHVA